MNCIPPELKLGDGTTLGFVLGDGALYLDRKRRQWHNVALLTPRELRETASILIKAAERLEGR